MMYDTRPRPRGFTLIEVIIAIALGSIVLLSISTMYLGARRSLELNESLVGMQETGRFTLEYLFSQGKFSGWNPHSVSIITRSSMQLLTTPISNSTIAPIDAVFVSTNPSPPSYAISEGGNTTIPDTLSLIVRLRSDPDCAGTTRSGTYIQAYFIDTTNNLLRCTPNAYNEVTGAVTTGTTQTITDAITNLQIRYGIDSNDDGSINYYTSASSIAQTASAGFADASSVAAIKVTISVKDIEGSDPLDDKDFSTNIRFIRK